MRKKFLLISCEHASNRIPDEYNKLLSVDAGLKDSHFAYDAHAVEVAQQLYRLYYRLLPCAYIEGNISRLLVDLNRSLSNQDLFSPTSHALPEAAKTDLIKNYYRPFRQRCHDLLRDHAQHYDQLIHLSIHSFVPTLHGKTRLCDIGLLYDPARQWEADLADTWVCRIRELSPSLNVQHNYPYLGIDDGHTTCLRTKFRKHEYAGVEVEMNQNLISSRTKQENIAKLLYDSLYDYLDI